MLNLFDWFSLAPLGLLAKFRFSARLDCVLTLLQFKTAAVPNILVVVSL